MRVLTPRSISWPQIPEDLPDDWKLWFRKFQLQLDDLVKDVHHDISDGNISFKIASSAPTVDDLNEGEFFLYDDGVSVRRLYTRVNATLRYLTLT